MDQDLFDSYRETIRVLQGRIHTLETQLKKQQEHSMRQYDDYQQRLGAKDQLIHQLDKELRVKDGEILVLELENAMLQKQSKKPKDADSKI